MKNFAARRKQLVRCAFSLIAAQPMIFLCLAFSTQAQAAQGHGLDLLPLEGRYAVSAAIGHDRPGYHARRDRIGLAAENRGQGLAARFDEFGVVIGAGSRSFSLRPVLWGYGDALQPLSAGVPQGVGNLVFNSRGGVSEWYVNGPLGLQQGFTVAGNALSGRGLLKVVMSLDGVKAGPVDPDGRGVMLMSESGAPLFRYGGLVVRDSGGRQATAWLEGQGDFLSICVDDAGLAYPLYIDPVIQLAKLTASDGATNDSLGCSVAVDGDTVMAGAYGDDIGSNSAQGSVYVFTRPPEGWSDGVEESAVLTVSDGAAGDSFGYSVSLSGDTAVIGASSDDIGANANQGSAYVFVKPAVGWKGDLTESAKLIASNGTANSSFGGSVSISGSTIVVGAKGYASNTGAAYVYVKPAGGWAGNLFENAQLAGSDSVANDYFGHAVAVSGDTVVVGAYGNDFNAKIDPGSAYVFVKPAAGWTGSLEQSAMLVAADALDGDYFGYSVAVDGDTVAVGASMDDSATPDQGAVYVFVKPEGGWKTTLPSNARLTASDGAASDNLGESVAVLNDIVVAGAPGDSTSVSTGVGSLYIFVKPQAGWDADIAESSKLIRNDGGAYEYFGNAVSISGDTVFAGASADDIGTNGNQGSAYVIKIIDDEPALQATNIMFPAVTEDSLTVSWTPGNGEGSIVFMRVGKAVDAVPADGVMYPDGVSFSLLTQVGDGNFVVYSGSATSVTVVDLDPETTYYVTVYEYNAASPYLGPNYLTKRPATGIQTTLKKRRCLALKLYGEGSAEVGLLRRYRDEVLAATTAGRTVIKLYYLLAPGVEGVLEESPFLQKAARGIIERLLPQIGRYVK